MNSINKKQTNEHEEREEREEPFKIDDQTLLDAVLDPTHSVTAEYVTLRFSQTQPGHNALAQLRHRLAAADAAAKAREMELLAVIEDLERLIPLVNQGGAP